MLRAQFVLNALGFFAAFPSRPWTWRLLAAAVIIAMAASHGPLYAQQATASGILADGNAVVTGFSGAQPPTLIAPQVDPADQTFVDLNGAALRVIDLQAPGAPPRAQLLQAAKPFAVTAGQIGQVFGVALDNAAPPNIYVAATSAYGLPIVAPSPSGDGSMVRAKHGAPGASFMPGVFGPNALQGGPGSIWRIDGATGEARLFANVMLDGAPNSGAALGGLAFDAASNSLFVADRGTGMIHRFDMTGADSSHYDHGAQGRPRASLSAVPFDSTKRLDITNAQFRTEDPATWGYAPPERRVFGVAVHAGRLYYAVAEPLQIWSVGLAPDGAFAADARIEVTLPPGAGASEISKIIFDDQERMVLAERAAPTGAYDFSALAQPGVGRVLRYAPATSATGAGAWQSAPDEYAIGFAGKMQNANGGVAVGYGYDAAGKYDRNSCGGFLWSTGEQLRVAADPELAARLNKTGATVVNGLQGDAVDLVRPANAPPLASYFVDYDDRLDDANVRGALGDVAIWRVCAPSLGKPVPTPLRPAPGAPGIAPPGPPSAPPSGMPGTPPPPPSIGPGEGPGPGPGFEEGGIELWWDGGPPPPPPICPPGMHLATNALQCCPPNQIPGFTGGCQPICPNGAADPVCWRGFQPGHGPGATGPADPGICWNGAPVTKLCIPNNLACNKCPKSPLKNCPSGFNLVTAPPGVPNATWLWSNATCVAAGPPCPPGQQRGLDGLCHADMCPAGQTAFPVNRCCLNGTAPNAHGQCPGILVPPLWFLDYIATGTGPCVPPNCSHYEFTITGRERFGRGTLIQRITLPPGSDFPEARVVKGAKYCPASRWSCSKSGDGFTCSAEDCGLVPGDQVVVRLEGRAAPELTAPPSTPVEKTACGVLEWQAMTGRSRRAAVEQPAEVGKALTQQPETQQAGASRILTPSKRACWTIRIVDKVPAAPTCARDYAPTAEGQCCMRSQLTAGGVCCPAGQRPDARRSACVAVCAGDRVWTGSTCACPQGSVERRGRCVSLVTPVIPQRACAPGETGVWPHCCPPGRYWNGRQCVHQPTTLPSCPAGTTGKYPDCQPIVVREPCPSGTVGRWQPHCRPIDVRQPCPPGTVGRWQPHCRQIVVRQPCPPGTVGRWQPHCRRIIEPQPCPPGMMGRYPHCRPIVQPRCPPGTIGRPPYCHPITRGPTQTWQTPGWRPHRPLPPGGPTHRSPPSGWPAHRATPFGGPH
jgi:hypothetical protein